MSRDGGEGLCHHVELETFTLSVVSSVSPSRVGECRASRCGAARRDETLIGESKETNERWSRQGARDCFDILSRHDAYRHPSRVCLGLRESNGRQRSVAARSPSGISPGAAAPATEAVTSSRLRATCSLSSAQIPAPPRSPEKLAPRRPSLGTDHHVRSLARVPCPRTRGCCTRLTTVVMQVFVPLIHGHRRPNEQQQPQPVSTTSAPFIDRVSTRSTTAPAPTPTLPTPTAAAAATTASWAGVLERAFTPEWERQWPAADKGTATDRTAIPLLAVRQSRPRQRKL